MQSYKITVAYDGTDYHGWQIQPHNITVAGLLQERFKRVFHEDIKLIGASRTDAGVHALGQVALLSSTRAVDPEKLKYAWNNVLPPSIVVRDICTVDSAFHPQRHVQEKTYYYHLFKHRPLPFIGRYGWFAKHDFCSEKLQGCLDVFVGTHDFRSFCTGYEQESTVRTVTSINVSYLKRFKAYRVAVKGPGFLRYMIRRIVGASILIASSKSRSIYELSEALESKDPAQALLTAPGQGLMLYKISYNTKAVTHLG